MGLRQAMTALAEQWDEVRARLDADRADRLAGLVARFVDEGDLGVSSDIATDIMDLLGDELPLEHPVMRALLGREDRFQDPARSAADLGAWFRLAEPLRARVDAAAPTADQVERTATKWLLSGPAIGADELRRRGQDPGDPELIRLPGDQWPAFQFERGGGPWAVVRTVNRILAAEEDPFGATDWWLGRSGRLGDVPAALIGVAPDDLLIAAARDDVAGEV